MATLDRVRVTWTGLTGLPGVSVFYGNGTGSLVSDLLAFFNALKGGSPAPLSWDVPTSGDQIDSSSGALTGTWSDPGGGTVVATGSGAYAAGTGFYVQWKTSGIVRSRRLQGRTFMAPINGGSYDSAGTIAAVTVSAAQTAANAVVAGGAMVIWSRPLPGAGSGGSASLVTGALVPDRVTSLRSRRT